MSPPSVARNAEEGEGWGDRRDLNPRQPESQSGALPTELRPPSNVDGIYTNRFSTRQEE